MTKGASDENFPVASWLLPVSMRKPVRDFYAFVREADDVADDPDLSDAEKKARLAAIRSRTAELGHGAGHAAALLNAFDQDVDKRRYATFAELMAYCRLSASPVGRYLIDLAGGGAAAYPASDALCAALQILNHLQDCGDDFRRLGRVYLPADWLAKAGVGEADLAAGQASPALRRVLDRALDEVDRLLDVAGGLDRAIGHRGLAREARGILALARRLADALRRQDPLRERVELGRFAAAATFLAGAAGLTGATVGRSSFAAAMRLLSGDRRAALSALYDFCRAVDDIADGEAPASEKVGRLRLWRDDVDRLFQGETPRLREVERLVGPVSRYGLERSDFLGLLDGMETDADGSVRMEDEAALRRYCDRVAGTVGRMAARIFGASPSLSGGLCAHLGNALQLTNILRDVAEDACRDRVYVPATLLARHGIPVGDADGARLHPNLGAALADLADEAGKEFDAAEKALAACDGDMRPARVMAAVYRRILARLTRAGWDRPGPSSALRLGRVEKTWIAVRYGMMR